MLNALLGSLDPVTGRMLGQEFKRLGEELLASATSAAELAAALDRRRQRRAANRKAAEAALRCVEAGMEPVAACALIATRRELEPEQVRGWLEIEHRKPAGRLRQRNRQIMRLAGRGWTDAAIAAKYQMHPKSVNRIVRRMLRANPSSVPQPVA
jgi:DNA-binding NarL/FixJ family response regulator